MPSRAIGITAASLLAIAICFNTGCSVTSSDFNSKTSGSQEAVGSAFNDQISDREPDESTTRRVSLSAVGDNLMHVPVVNTADAADGTSGDDHYNFQALYAGIEDIVSTHDINFIDIETIIGGDEKGIQGYPTFNTPEENAEDIADFGFNLATTASNHSYDQGLDGILKSSEVWAAQSEVVVTGSFVNQEDRDHIRVFEKNGIDFAFLAYTDSLNGFVLPSDQTWAVATTYDEDQIRTDIQKAHELADVIIVAISWGEEYAFIPSASQNHLAQLFADLDVDLVLGFGPHVIQPIQWLSNQTDSTSPDENSDEDSKHQTLVVYSLGNFISNQQDTFANVGGCFTCEFVQEAFSDVYIENLSWIPLINHFSQWTGHRVYQFKDYTNELGKSHDVLSRLTDPLDYARELTTDVIDPEVISIEF